MEIFMDTGGMRGLQAVGGHGGAAGAPHLSHGCATSHSPMDARGMRGLRAVGGHGGVAGAPHLSHGCVTSHSPMDASHLTHPWMRHISLSHGCAASHSPMDAPHLTHLWMRHISLTYGCARHARTASCWRPWRCGGSGCAAAWADEQGRNPHPPARQSALPRSVSVRNHACFHEALGVACLFATGHGM